MGLSHTEGVDPISVTSLANKITTEGEAYAFMEEIRWGKDREMLACPHCGHGKAYFLTPKAENGRTTRTGTVTERRVWKCAKCRKQFSVMTDTCFHGSKVSLRTWLFIVFEMCANKNGLSARE